MPYKLFNQASPPKYFDKARYTCVTFTSIPNGEINSKCKLTWNVLRMFSAIYGCRLQVEIFDPFWISFSHDVWQNCHTIILHVDMWLTQHHFLRSLSFLYWMVLHCSWKALKPICEDLSQGFYSVELVYVWPEASTTMSFWFLELCSKFWHWQVWFLQFCTCISSDNSHVEFLAVQIWHS